MRSAIGASAISRIHVRFALQISHNPFTLLLFFFREVKKYKKREGSWKEANKKCTITGGYWREVEKCQK